MNSAVKKMKKYSVAGGLEGRFAGGGEASVDLTAWGVENAERGERVMVMVVERVVARANAANVERKESFYLQR